MQAARGPVSQYSPGLDVVRGVAILMVLAVHGLAYDPRVFTASGSRWMLALGYVLRLGHLGVHLFFILSGLLITRILLDTRGDRDFFRNFYARRALRILPAYLLLLGGLLIAHAVSAQYVAVCLLFLANMTTRSGVGNQYGALWSLSVEEQFYLVWPITVRRLSTRSLAAFCTCIVLLTPFLRFALLYGPRFVHDIRFKTWAVGDFFAAGALMAISVRGRNLPLRLRKWAWPLMGIGALLVIAQHAIAKSSGGAMLNVMHALYLEPWLLALSGFVLFGLLHPGISQPLVARPLVFLAKISYGLYLCHPFVFSFVANHWPQRLRAGEGAFAGLLLRFTAGLAISIMIAALSRFTVEEFFLRFKPKHLSAQVVGKAAAKIT